MKLVRNLWPLVITAALAALPAGCPPEPGDTATMAPPSSGEPGTLTLAVQAPESAETGETVTLAADLPDGTDPTALFFEWFQTYGRAVELVDATAPEASFVAPSFGRNEMVGFRVDVKDAAGRVSSQALDLLVMADPDFSFGGSSDGSVTPIDPTADPRPVVRVVTSRGVITVELNRTAAPVSVANFLQYVDDGFYDGLIFHRVIPGFVIQGGGYDDELNEIETRPPIVNEASNGLGNDRGTIAMARTNDPDSATSQFYFNLVDNNSLNARDGSAGYAVFGEITEGLEVIDDIADEPTETRGGFDDVPRQTIRIFTVERLDS